MTTDTALEVLDVEVTPLPSPLRLAQPAFLSSLKECETQIAALKITDATSAQLAATLQARLTTAGKMLEDTRARLKAPVLAQGKAIDEAARAPAARIAAAKQSLSAAQIAYAEEQQRIARKLEADRQAELARLERVRQIEEFAAKKKADELAKQLAEAAAKSKAPTLEIDEDDAPPAVVEPPPKTETEKQIEAIQHTPVVAAPKPAGVSYRVVLIHKVESVAKLPEPFVIRSANDAALRATYCAGWREGEPLPVVPGVVFTVQKTVVSTGRSVF